MKSKILMIAAALTVVGSLTMPSAQAYSGHGGGGFHGGGFHGGHSSFRGHYGGYGHGGRYYGGLGWGLAAGALLAAPYLYSDYYDPAYVDSGSVVYEGDSAPVQVAPSSAPPVWYYCQSPRGYYPYIPSCPTGWQQVPAVPPH